MGGAICVRLVALQIVITTISSAGPTATAEADEIQAMRGAIFDRAASAGQESSG